MIRAIACFVAEGITTDAESRQVSAFGLVEELQAQGFPATLPRMALFSLWERVLSDSPEHGIELSVTLNGHDLARQVIAINFAQALRSRSIVRFEGLAVTEAGSLVFRLAIPGHDGAQWVVAVGSTQPQGVLPGPVLLAAGASSPAYGSQQPISLSFDKVNIHR